MKPRGRPFRPGNLGRPRGSKNKTTQVVEQLAAGCAEEIVQRVIKQARDGDTASQRMLLDRICPMRKGRPIDIDLPPIKTVQDVLAAIPLLWTAIAEGRLTPDEASAMSEVAERSMAAIETHDVCSRLDQLEQQVSPTDEEEQL
jgi:hypothetical protein